MVPALLSAVCLTVCLMVSGVWTDKHNVKARQQDPANNTIAVTINPGQELRGAYRVLVTGKVIYKFWGIRFGKAPTGDRRFAEPEAEDDWQGQKDALQKGKKCIQSSGANPDESEDCLFLNVFTPSVNGSAPVMVWIHGGGYNTGSGSELMYDGSTLAGRGVVVVTINYRLGPFGFMSTGDDVMPGNYGMLDQVLALKWVQKNIHAFGGDPGAVTIFGQSAGSTSVSLQVLSPLSKGLFHRAIMESGSSLDVWAVDRPSTEVGVEKYTQTVGEHVGCDVQSSSKFLTCLRQLDDQVIFNASYNLRKSLNIDILATPRVETTFGFLPNYPQYLLDNGLFNKVDTLRGFNSGEWSFVIADPELDGLTREEFTMTFSNIDTTYLLDNRSRKYINDLVERVYIGNETNLITIRTNAVNALADLLFGLGEVLELDKFIQNGAESNRHYVYEFDYKVQSMLSTFSLAPDWMGTLHGGELPFVFAADLIGEVAYLTPDDDVAVGEKTQSWWTNFAKFGNPTATPIVEGGDEVRWDPYSVVNPQLLKISLQSSFIPYPRQDFLPQYNEVLNFLKNENTTQGV
jgi:carboxylesterase type B